ncbi:NAD-dependent epimerase/dehydratase family protein [Streptomyces benahoarensis]|uniref:NAD-dependent epimerase/dehydratase family protein n=1 Tax=Streptomyces benahoarensis TaxID=2595054 RepID=A0A553ZGX8_9ACTN|nr:NAD-dependent epimerase/dehydratase family protein [Streptomyces benahoarensis]TSB20698.1 NAD-dependent epimerase/dehydratase family protein [Streptomyces benahoarensis]TSB40679.1 NAD-dependent epimerase/dehydratase family protein [Streptomyces benahoarensis]
MHDNRLKELAGRTVLVTGGAGLIGSRIAACLRRAGARPLSLCTLDAYPQHTYRDLFGIDPADPDVIVGNIQNPDAVKKAVAGSDYVIHAAALADVAACTRNPMAAIHTNITGTQVLLDAVAACERVRRLVFVSSASVYGNGNPDDWARPSEECRAVRQLLEAVYGRVPPQFHEHTPLRPMSVYANSKAWGESQTTLTLGPMGTSYTVVRYFSVYGEPQVIKESSHSWVVAWFATRAALGLPLHLNGGGHQVRDLVHVEDIATATVRALVAPRAHNETINIGTGTPTSIRKVAELVAEHRPDTRFVETPMPPGDPLGGYAGTHRMETVLGWRPTITLKEGVARYANWLDNNPGAIPVWLRSQPEAAAS